MNGFSFHSVCVWLLLLECLLQVSVVTGASQYPCDSGDEACKQDFEALRKTDADLSSEELGDKRSLFGAVLDIILGKDKEYQAQLKQQKQQESRDVTESQLRAMEFVSTVFFMERIFFF